MKVTRVLQVRHKSPNLQSQKHSHMSSHKSHKSTLTKLKDKKVQSQCHKFKLMKSSHKCLATAFLLSQVPRVFKYPVTECSPIRPKFQSHKWRYGNLLAHIVFCTVSIVLYLWWRFYSRKVTFQRPSGQSSLAVVKCYTFLPKTSIYVAQEKNYFPLLGAVMDCTSIR